MSADPSPALDAIEAALQLLAERAVRNPGYGVYVHAREQLDRMRSLAQAAPRPSPAQRDFVDIDLMAAKELESSDEALADALMRAAYEFKRGA
jgi:hypothetical protein